MKKFITVFSLMIAASISAMAQYSADHNQAEFFIGYSNGQVDTGFEGITSANTGVGDRSTFHGFNVSAVYNFGRYVGLKGDLSGTYNTTRFSFPVTTGTTTQTVSFDTNNSLYNFVGGVQIKDNSTEKTFKPFVHAMAGVGHGRTNVNNLTCTSTPLINCAQIINETATGFAAVLGGGLDIKVSDKIDIRAFQADYNPIVFDEGRGTTHNFRFGVGVVFK